MFLFVFTYIFFLFYADILVWFDAGCSCDYSLHEEGGTRQVCVQLLFVGGTELTTSDYNVTVSPDTSSSTANSKSISI